MSDSDGAVAAPVPASVILAYPAALRTVGRDVEVRFADFPAARAQAPDAAEALRAAQVALEAAVIACLADGSPLPLPRAPAAGQVSVVLAGQTAAKAALALALREIGLSKSALARRLGLSEKAVRRLLDPRHYSKTTGLEAALAACGWQLVAVMRRTRTGPQAGQSGDQRPTA